MKFKLPLIVFALVAATSSAYAGWTYPPPFQATALSLPPDEQSPPIQSGEAATVAYNYDEMDADTIRDILPIFVSSNSVERQKIIQSLTPAEKASLYKTAMLAREVLIEAKQKQ